MSNLPKVSKGHGDKKIKVDSVKYIEKIVGNVWFRLMYFEKKGEKKLAHVHNFDHVHFVATGKVRIYELKEEYDSELKDYVVIKKPIGDFTAPAFIEVPKGIAHEVESLEDNTLAICVQAVRDEEGKILETNFVELREIKEGTHEKTRL